jgi:glycosyltransferase involved in cell wall biosynthesis
LYGEDYPEHDYRSMARELGVMDSVHFFPFENDILSLYQSADCFVLPSRGEGLSNALLEAMAMELAVIATSVSGTTDVVDDGKDGILIPPDSPEALFAAMVRIIRDREMAGQLGLNARRKVEQHFSLESVARQYSELYGNL